VAGFFLDNRLCQITVQTFSIIIATFPSANTYAMSTIAIWYRLVRSCDFSSEVNTTVLCGGLVPRMRRQFSTVVERWHMFDDRGLHQENSR